MSTVLNLNINQQGLKVTIYDSHNRVQLSDYLSKRFCVELPDGIYTIRSELSGQFIDRKILLEGTPVELTIELPYYSAAPLRHIATSHEYYTRQAHRLSIKGSHQSHKFTVPTKAGILVFLRCSSREQFQRYAHADNFLEQLKKRFSFVSEHLPPFVTSPKWESNNTDGWIGFCSQFLPGLYHLVYQNEETHDQDRQIPIYIFQSWQTQLFVTLGPDPLFSDMRIQLSPIGRGINYDDELSYDIDYASDRLQNGRFRFPALILKRLEKSSRENPILGLLWAYSVLLDETKQVKNEGDIERVLNWTYQVKNFDWPDLEVIRLLCNKKLGLHAPDVKIHQPPVLTIGIRQLLELSREQPNLIDEHSLTSRIFTELLNDSMWTSWNPLPLSSTHIGDLTNFREDIHESFTHGLAPIKPGGSTRSSAYNNVTKANWAEIGIAMSINKNPQIGLEQLALEVNIPFSTAKNIVSRLAKNNIARGVLINSFAGRKITLIDESIFHRKLLSLLEAHSMD